jgi:hypothetical protein
MSRQLGGDALTIPVQDGATDAWVVLAMAAGTGGTR